MSLFLGRRVADDSAVELPLRAFHRHLVALGSSGSGKTVLCKCIMEEAVRNEVPLVIVDPQGDISSLALKGDATELQRNGTPLTIQEEFFDSARIAIFTPASSKAIPISVNPLSLPPASSPHEEATLALDMTAGSVAGFLGYDLNSDSGKGAKAYIFMILQNLWGKGQEIEDLSQMADLVLSPPKEIKGTLFDLVTKQEPHEIARRLRFLTVGTASLLFQMGVQINIDMFTDRSDGKVPVNIIYLNTLSSSADKHFFISTLMKELYLWMLKNPSESIQLLFYVDEIAPYIPPYPRNPPPKEAYALLFKQARKYGVGLVAATQNVTDIDYKALAQVNTWCLGRMMTNQDVSRVSKIVQSVDPERAGAVLQRLPSLQTGEFLMLSPDFYDNVVDFRVRWLASRHSTLDEKSLSPLLSEESKAFFERYLQKPKEVPGVLHQARPSASLSRPVAERVRLFLNSERKAVSIKSITESLNAKTEDVEEALRQLSRERLVQEGRLRGSSENLFWLSRFGFRPSKNIVGEILVVPVRITQIQATKRAGRMLEGGFLSKKEEIDDARFFYIPIWRLSAARETKRLLFFKRSDLEIYYLSAEDGSILTLERKKIVFSKLVKKDSRRLKDLDQDDTITFIPKLPDEIEVLPKIKIGVEGISRRLQLKLGVRPVSAELVLLPVWSLKIVHKKKSSRRSIILDAATGRTVSGLPARAFKGMSRL